MQAAKSAREMRSEYVTKKRPADTDDVYVGRVEAKRDSAQRKLERQTHKFPASGPAPGKKDIAKMVLLRAQCIQYQYLLDILANGVAEGASEEAAKARRDLILEAEKRYADNQANDSD